MSLIGDLLSLPIPTSWEAFSDGPLSLSQQVFYWSALITILVFGWLLYAVYAYRRKEGDPDPPDAAVPPPPTAAAPVMAPPYAQPAQPSTFFGPGSSYSA